MPVLSAVQCTELCFKLCSICPHIMFLKGLFTCPGQPEGQDSGLPHILRHEDSLIELRLGDSIIVLQCTRTSQRRASSLSLSLNFCSYQLGDTSRLPGVQSSRVYKLWSQRTVHISILQNLSLKLEHHKILAYPPQFGPIRNKSSCWDNHKGSRINQELGPGWMASSVSYTRQFL